MTVELLTEAPLAPPAGLGPYRREDYDALPDQPRCELLYGRLYVTPSPTRRHQLVALFLWRHLESIAEAGIREYWIVDPETRHVEFLVNEAGRFVVSLPAAGVYRSPQVPEIHLDVADFWRQVESRYPAGR